MKSLLISIIFIILIITFLPSGVYYYLVWTITDYRVIETIESFKDFPKVWEFEEGKIINTARENYIFPDDPLEYQVNVFNPKEEDRELSSRLLIFKGGELEVEPIERKWLIRGNDKIQTDIEFFLKEEGTYELELQFIFDTQIPGSEHPNHTFYIKNIQVQSLSNKLLADANHNSFWSYLTILSVAIGGNMGSIIYLKKQNKHTENQLKLAKEELESRLRAELEISVQKSDLEKTADEKWMGTISIHVRNNGSVSARNVKVHFKDPTSSLDLSQLIHDEKEIKKTSFPIPGSISKQYYYPEVITHNTPLDQSGVYEVAIWVTYDYGEVKNMEFIQIIKVNAQANSEGTLYEKEDIEKERERMKNQGLIQK